MKPNLALWSFSALLTLGIDVQAATSSARGTLLPEVLVTDTKLADKLLEERPVGAYDQPAWTSKRRFATTRVYVLPQGQVEFEQWWKGKYPRDSGKADHLFQSEIGVGLPHRLQLDLYANIAHAASEDTRYIGSQVELRWALADWGKIALNPTLYGEWKFNNSNAPDAYEVKLLLSDELAGGWHWGLNAFFEQETGGGRATESGFSQAISYTLADQKLSAGLEMKVERASAPHLHGVPNDEALAGPSLQWVPVPGVHLDFVPLFGTTHESPDLEAYIVLGIELGGGSGGPEIMAPTSTRSH